MSFYDNYLRLCSLHGVSPSATAKKVGVDKSSVSRWARGSAPRRQTLLRVADYFGVSVEDLLGDEMIVEKETTERVVSNPVVDREEEKETNGLDAALEALRNQPGRRALLSATKNMTEAQVLRFADWLADITGGNRD